MIIETSPSRKRWVMPGGQCPIQVITLLSDVFRKTRNLTRGNPVGVIRVHAAAAGGDPMQFQKLYAALLTADLAAAEAWYSRLFGRGPDHRPMDTLLHWELF